MLYWQHIGEWCGDSKCHLISPLTSFSRLNKVKFIIVPLCVSGIFISAISFVSIFTSCLMSFIHLYYLYFTFLASSFASLSPQLDCSPTGLFSLSALWVYCVVYSLPVIRYQNVYLLFEGPPCASSFLDSSFGFFSVF